MKALYNYLVLLLLIVINTSCLKAGWKRTIRMILQIFVLNTDGGMRVVKDSG
jgi:hypothetical protein